MEQLELDLGIEIPAAFTVEQFVADLVDGIDTDEITPYVLHKVVNTTLEVMGLDYRVRPQMMYNYAANGMIVKGQKGLKRFTRIQVAEFTIRFVNRQLSK